MVHENTKEIQTVAIVGLGALGILYGNQLAKGMPKETLRVIADERRIKRYQTEKIYCNKEECDFNYVTPNQKCEAADLVIFTVKYQGLRDAIEAMKNQIGKNTIILSALNGITSEAIIGETYGMENILYCVAQGMDAVKEENHLTYDHMGLLVFGDREKDSISSNVRKVASFFERIKIPYQIDSDMRKRLWGKFMLNVGVNQTVAVYEGNYGTIQKEGPERSAMILAMREVIALSEMEGINLTEEDLNYWLSVLATLSPQGKPSMRQDLEARRLSEVELFAGTVLEYGKKHGLPTPVNRELYDRIKVLESSYSSFRS
jgi:2-dehydropantoate 2-reductase